MLRRVVFAGLCLLVLVLGGARHTLAEPSQPNIVGGEEATANEFPWQVALTRYNGTHCGGSLIAANWVVTAAHCVTGSTSALRVELGIHNIWTLTSNPFRQQLTIKRIISHPQYNSVSGDYDIALIETTTNATLNAAVNIIALAHSTDHALYAPSDLNTVASWPIVSGWGALSFGGSSAQYLRKVAVPVVSNATCNTNYGGGITDRMLCAGHPRGGIDSCQGDSGGPLFGYDNGTPLLIGIVSMGEGCALPNYPGIYANVANLYPWVASYVPLGAVPTRTATLSLTPTNTRTLTLSHTPSNTRTPTNSRTPTSTMTASNTPTPSKTFTASKTFTVSRTATDTFTPSLTRTPSSTRTSTLTRTPSNTRTTTNTRTNTRTFTVTHTATPLPEWMRRIDNGNFEAGNTVWYETSVKYPNVITLETSAIAARSGQYFAWFGGANDDVSVITQTIQVRSDARFLRLYYLAASHEDDCKIIYDTARIYVNDNVLPGGDIPLCKGKNVGAWRAVTFNLTSYIDQRITLRIQVITDSSYESSFWVDDIGFVRTATEQLNYYGKVTTTAGSPTPVR